MSDKLKGQMSKSTVRGSGSTGGPWPASGALGTQSQNVAAVMRTGKGVITSASGAYRLTNDGNRSDAISTSSPKKSHRRPIKPGLKPKDAAYKR